ncbi:MAG: hypothetical protein JRL30_28745 [Deltaproteobacteria bacterium]|nr:hypothetical protein [Deltaproteobacteria bacterium]MBW2001072.1 hypothetical protein [Deltaproteobacteria bacterium]
MKPLHHKYEALKKILRKAYFEKEHAEIGDQWQMNLMRRIRNLGPVQSSPSFVMLFEQFVWRLTPATCLLIIVGAIIFLKLGFFPDYDVLTLFINNTEELSLAQLF